MSEPFPRLDDPPISEVVCGFRFAPLKIDAMHFGLYWRTRVDDFPKKELHPALFDGFGRVDIGPAPLRAWLIAASNDILLQLQSDRFYMNWRHGGEHYPRFSNHDDREGLKQRAIQEFSRFQQFCIEELGEAPVLSRLELSKIDILEHGRHFESTDDLGKLLKVASGFRYIDGSSEPELQLRFRAGDDVAVAIMLGGQRARIEIATHFEPTDDVDTAFDQANARVNSAFFGLFFKKELKRFQRRSK